MSRLSSFWADSRGSASAELVLTMPIMLLLLLGASEVSYYFYSEHQVVKGVRDGARFGGRQSFTDLNCSGGSPSTVPAGIETAIQEVTRTGRVSGGTARVPGWVNADITVTVTCPATAITTGIYRDADNAPQINVSANVAYDSLFGNLNFFSLDGADLNASQQAGVMGI